MNALHGLETKRAHTRERTGLALTLLVIEVAIFFGFIAVGAYSPRSLAVPLTGDGVITVAFLYGIVILIVSVLLTGLYVLVENASEA